MIVVLREGAFFKQEFLLSQEEKGGMQNKEKKELFDWVKNTLGSVKVGSSAFV